MVAISGTGETNPKQPRISGKFKLFMSIIILGVCFFLFLRYFRHQQQKHHSLVQIESCTTGEVDTIDVFHYGRLEINNNSRLSYPQLEDRDVSQIVIRVNVCHFRILSTEIVDKE